MATLGHGTFQTEEAALPQIRGWIWANLGARSGRAEGYQFIQAVDELCSNIIEHGGDFPLEQSHGIKIELRSDPTKLEARVIYDGDDFDMMRFASASVGDLIEKKLKGGLGIRLIKALSTHVGYKHISGLNVCTIRKALAPTA